ncbi:phage head morphogenesis protein [Desulfovulcanus sp.]
MVDILVDAFNLPPEEAIEYLKSKGYEISFDWWELWEEAHAKAFTVAKAMQLDILSDIKEMVDKAIEDGITFHEFKKELEPKLKSKGWWGKQKVIDPKTGKEVLAWLGTPWRLKTIFNQNVQTAYMAGRYKQMQKTAEKRPYWQYLAVMDSRTRPSHARLHNRIFPADDPFWDSFYPPNGWNCRCHVRSLSKNQLKNYGLEDKVESSEGKLFTEDKLVSKKTGEMRPVTVFKDGDTKISPDVGFSYNPGKEAWQPDINKWPEELQKLWENK